MNDRIKLFFVSFLILFLELALIRFLPANIVYLGYYANYILLASFVGMGGGILMANNKRDYLPLIFPLFLFIVIFFSSYFQISIISTTENEINFTNNYNGYVIPELILVPLIFVLVTITFTLISYSFGILLNKLPPLVAYKWDILGSLSSIIAFAVFSYFNTAPIVWFGVFIIIYILVFLGQNIIWGIISFLPFILIVFAFLKLNNPNDRWSPYQKITVNPIYKSENSKEITGYSLLVNNILHQGAQLDLSETEWFYSYFYNAFTDNKFNNALIIGSGSGKDVYFALQNNVDKVDAVEIDPVILQIAKDLNPYKPYQDHRVTTYITDARSFLAHTNNKYDLIVYALPDSLVMAATHGNIRLESFLFTIESFRSVKNHLKDNGLLVLYNYYREPWLIAKLTIMLDSVFDNMTYVQVRQPGYNGLLMNGDRLKILKNDIIPSNRIILPNHAATDNWPFLYLKNPHLSSQYMKMLSIIALFIIVYLTLIIKKPIFQIINPLYFFMGTAFLLLETKSIIHFSLLFGSTWLVNALVFFAILSMVLGAIYIVNHIKIRNIVNWYIFLFISLIIQLLIPLQSLLSLSLIPRYISVSIFTLIPVFIANIIFSYHFKESKNNSTNFASNLLGAAVGGILEYAALLTGYRDLTYIVILSYFLSFFPIFRYQFKKLR